MTQEQIREIVRLTVDELTNRKMLQIDSYQTVLRAVEVNLYNFFDDKNKANDERIVYILRHLSDDQYIDIIFLNYRDGKTLEWIAEYLDRDISTIKRNKKRLILKIYELLEL